MNHVNSVSLDQNTIGSSEIAINMQAQRGLVRRIVSSRHPFSVVEAFRYVREKTAVKKFEPSQCMYWAL
jgi:hypothetical protein